MRIQLFSALHMANLILKYVQENIDWKSGVGVCHTMEWRKYNEFILVVDSSQELQNMVQHQRHRL